MFVPVDREIILRLNHGEKNEEDTQVNCVTCNRERNLVAVVLNATLQIWLTHPQLLLCTVTLPESDVRDRGTLQKAFWRFDSTYIAVTTSRNSILVFRVNFLDDDCYHLRDPNDANFQRMSQELFLRCPRPSISLQPSVVMNLAAAATCCVPLREELLVCLRNGFCHHIAWDGTVHSDYSIKLASVPFAHDQLQSKPDYLNDPTIHVVSAVYAPLVGGYCIVLSDGRAALLTSSDSRFHPNSLLGVWALHLKDATCCDVNHKFRLLVFGCANGDVCAFHLDDSNGSIVQTFRVPLRIRDGPDITCKIGPVVDIQVLSGGSAFAAVWKAKDETAHQLPPTSAIFTPFGSQTFCSLESLQESDSSLEAEYTSVEWGPEGYYLLFGKSNGFSFLPVAHSASVSNPSMYHSDRTVLLCSNKIMISPPRHREASATAPNTVWTTITVPNEYIAANWPIRLVSSDNESSKVLVIAGAKGLAHCNITTGKWRIFGNESQERDILVTGGVFVWDQVLGAACFDADSGKESLRFYPLATKLDNSYASVIETDSRVVMLSSRRDSLVTFDVDTKIMLYKIHLTDTKTVDSFVKVELDRLAEIRVSDLITHPACLVSIHLTQLSLEKEAATFMPAVDTVLVNISGRLITLNPKNVAKEDDERFQLNQPIMVASFVEHIWHDPVREEISPSPSRSNGNARCISDEGASHLEHALWINCGSKGMRVWLPLFPSRRTTAAQDTSFISKRIMLPFELDIVPIVISSMDCLAIGLESVPQSISAYSGAKGVIYSVHRNSEVFVHHLLRQLLKRNLGVFALEMAANCRNLPHFPHSLELLLHGVLEEEATSSEPIPDPLLPRCIAFIQEFPENLKTIAHCARKTELALWSSLFAVTGPPNDLFENCLRDGQLHTAASYLIILQSMENATTSLEQASRLLTEALAVGDWTIVKDMMRFARSIDADDMDDRPIRTPPPSKPSSRRPTASLSLNGSEANELVFSRFQAVGRVNKVRTSLEHKESTRKDSSGSGRKVGRVQSLDGGPPSPCLEPNPLAERMDHIVDEHALRLLDEYCIRDLGYLCSHLSLDIRHLVLQRPVADYSLALTRLHSQFGWPYPVPGKHVVDQLEKRFGSMRVSRSTASLNGNSLLESPLSKSAARQKSELVSTIPAEITDETDSVSVKEAKLRPLGYQDSGTDSLIPERVPSPGGSSVSQTVGTPDTRSASVDWQGVDLLVGESSVRGSSESQAQLNHMLRLFSDIGAVEWVFLLCVVARDSVSLRREISPANITKWGIESFGYARLGCLDMIKWAEANCIGYVPILHIFSAHLNLVAEQAGCLNLPPRRKSHPQQFAENGDMKLSDVPRRAKNPKDLNSSYRRRDRSQSVDRDHVVNGNDESEGCSIM